MNDELYLRLSFGGREMKVIQRTRKPESKFKKIKIRRLCQSTPGQKESQRKYEV
jgi:hypothetical protein